MAYRQYTITLINQSGATLTLLSSKFCGGAPNGALPSPIPTGTTVTFGAQSDGIFTGTEGYVIYKCPDSPADPRITPGEGPGPPTQLYLYWDNPDIGTTRAGSLVSTADIASTFLDGNCSAQYPSGSTLEPASVYQVIPSATWDGGESAGNSLNYIYPASQGPSGDGLKQLAGGLIPGYGIYEMFGSLFSGPENDPDAVNYFVFSLQPKFFGNPASLRKFLLDRGANLSKGLRELTMAPPNNQPTSVRAMMGLS